MTLEEHIGRVVARALDDRTAAPLTLTDEQLELLAESIGQVVARENRRFHLLQLPDSARLSKDDAMELLEIRSDTTWRKYRKLRKLPPAICTPTGERWRKGDLLRDAS